MKFPPLMLSVQLSCQALAFEMNAEHQSVGTMNNADSMHITNNNVHGSYADESQNNRIIGDGNAIQSQFKPCEGSSNEDAGSAVCCASKAGGACCASAAEAGHDASTSTDCPEHMPFEKKIEVLSRQAEAQFTRPLPKTTRVVLIYIISVISTMVLRFLYGWTRQGHLHGVGVEMTGDALPETESLCHCEGSDVESSAAVRDLHYHTAAHANCALQKHHRSHRARGCLVCLALSCAVAAAMLAFNPQASLVHAKTSQELGLVSMSVGTQNIGTQNNADNMVINYFGNQVPKSVNFGDGTMELHQPYRLLWDMDHLPAGDPDRDTLARVRHLLGSSGLEMYWDGDDKGLILDHISSEMKPVFAELSSSAEKLEWSLDFDPSNDCWQLVTTTTMGGRCLTAHSRLHLDQCTSARPQCWRLHHSSRKIQNSGTGKCIGISSKYVSIERQHANEKLALASGAGTGVMTMAGLGLVTVAGAAATGGVSLLVGAAAAGSAYLAMPKDPLTISVWMRNCDSDWAINWNIQEV